MALSGGRLHDAMVAEAADEGRALPVFGVPEAELAFLVAAPGVDRPVLGDGENVNRARPGRHELDLNKQVNGFISRGNKQ